MQEPRSHVRTLRGLYAIVDPDWCGGRDPVDVARAILRGGAAALQLRAKRMDGPTRERLGHALHELCTTAGVPFYVNDFAELARRLGADGLHLGQGDMPIADARAIVGDDAAIGVSTHSLAQALAAEQAGADLIGFGPVFATRTKHNPDPVVGLTGLSEVCQRVAIPAIAIGGIDTANAHEVAATGAPLAAAIGAVCGAADPEAAARTMHRTLTGA